MELNYLPGKLGLLSASHEEKHCTPCPERGRGEEVSSEPAPPSLGSSLDHGVMGTQLQVALRKAADAFSEMFALCL